MDILYPGWHPQPNTRGTFDIVWSCLSTIVVCIWSMLHLNIPSATDSHRSLFWRRVRWCTLAVLAPEVPMLIAAGQWASAKRSVHDMAQEEWTLVHALYADSGGFQIRCSDGAGSFPATARQMKYLVDTNAITIPNITRQEIWDKSKGDRLVKLLALLQTVWLTAQVVARVIQRLPVTPLELATVATALPSLTTLYFWWQKPLDVRVPTVVQLNKPVVVGTQIKQEQERMQSFNMPLESVEPEVYISRKWSKRVFRWIVKAGLQTPGLSRIPNDRDPQLLNLTQHVAIGVATALFASLHFVDWNFRFPTTLESQLWQINCAAVCILLGVYGSAEVIACRRERHLNMGLDTMGGYKRRWPACLFFFIPGGLYFLCRIFVVVEVFISLRALPEGAFQCVDWSAFIPHW